MELRRGTRGALHRALGLEIPACGDALACFVESPRQTFEHLVCRRSARELRNVVNASGQIGRPEVHEGGDQHFSMHIRRRFLDNMTDALHSFAACVTAATQSECTVPPSSFFVDTAMRRRCGFCDNTARYDGGGSGAQYGSPPMPPTVASSAAALSRTLRETTCSLASPSMLSPKSGA